MPIRTLLVASSSSPPPWTHLLYYNHFPDDDKVLCAVPEHSLGGELYGFLARTNGPILVVGAVAALERRRSLLGRRCRRREQQKNLGPAPDTRRQGPENGTHARLDDAPSGPPHQGVPRSREKVSHLSPAVGDSRSGRRSVAAALAQLPNRRMHSLFRHSHASSGNGRTIRN